MVNAALFFAEVYLIISVNSTLLNWDGVSKILFFMVAGSMLVLVLYDWAFKKVISNIRDEYGDVIADDIVKSIKVKFIKDVKYSSIIVFFLGVISVIALREFPITVVLLIIILLFGAFIIWISFDARLAADRALARLRSS